LAANTSEKQWKSLCSKASAVRPLPVRPCSSCSPRPHPWSQRDINALSHSGRIKWQSPSVAHRRQGSRNGRCARSAGSGGNMSRAPGTLAPSSKHLHAKNLQPILAHCRHHLAIAAYSHRLCKIQIVFKPQPAGRECLLPKEHVP